MASSRHHREPLESDEPPPESPWPLPQSRLWPRASELSLASPPQPWVFCSRWLVFKPPAVFEPSRSYLAPATVSRRAARCCGLETSPPAYEPGSPPQPCPAASRRLVGPVLEWLSTCCAAPSPVVAARRLIICMMWLSFGQETDMAGGTFMCNTSAKEQFLWIKRFLDLPFFVDNVKQGMPLFFSLTATSTSCTGCLRLPLMMDGILLIELL